MSTRNGIASLFLACEPLAGWRHTEVTTHRRQTAWAGFIRALLEERYSETERVALIVDQLNTHSPASHYEAFPPAEAKRLADRLEMHHTPKRRPGSRRGDPRRLHPSRHARPSGRDRTAS
jgi:hypothetical protein